MGFYKKHLFFCVNMKDSGKKCCGASNGKDYAQYCRDYLNTRGLYGKDQFGVTLTHCLGRCALGPCLVIYPEGVWYSYHHTKDIDLIIEEHCLKNSPVDSLLIKDETSPQG